MKIKKVDGNTVEFYVSDKPFLSVSLDDIQALSTDIKKKLLMYGLSVLLQRETAGIKDENVQKEKVLKRWSCLKTGNWKCKREVDKQDLRKKTQIETLEKLPIDVRKQVIESLKASNSLHLSDEDVAKLLAQQ